MIYKGKRSGVTHNFPMDVSLGYIYIAKFRAGIQSYMKESKDVFASISLKITNEIGKSTSFNGQNVTFLRSIREIQETDTSLYMSTCTRVYLHLYEYLYTPKKIFIFIEIYEYLYLGILTIILVFEFQHIKSLGH